MSILKNVGAFFERSAMSRRASLLLCFFAGAAGALPYFVKELFIFTFVSIFLIFYIAVSQKREHKKAFAPFFWYFLGLYIPLYSFLSEMYPFDRFGFTESQANFVLFCACLGIPLLHASVQATVMLLSKAFSHKHFDAFGYASLWVIAEWLLSLGFMAFPWGGVAVSMTGFLPYLQTASLFGKYFITFITALACYYFASAIIDKKLKLSIIASSMIIVNILAGYVIWAIPSKNAEPVKVALIQGNVLSNEKWADENKSAIFQRYIGMAKEAAENNVNVVLLPESAIPTYFVPNGALHKVFADIARQYNVTLVSGVQYYDFESDEYFNAVVSVYPDGSLSDHYGKRHLVPFGEFVPFADTIGDILPFVKEFNESSNSFTEGTKAVIFESEKANISPLVCFDSIFTRYSREAATEGAELIAIVTNDSWFNDSVGVTTHLRHAQIRAIENKKSVIRAANTGISASITQRGQILTSTEPLVQDIEYTEVYTNQGKTLYTLIGDVIVYLSFITLISLIISQFFKRKEH